MRLLPSLAFLTPALSCRPEPSVLIESMDGLWEIDTI